MTAEPSRARFRRAEPSSRWRPVHQARAGLGVWCAGRSERDRAAIKRWKRTHPLNVDDLAEFAAAVADLVRAWSPVLPRGTVVTTPPQGASLGLPYAAEALGRCVSLNLGLPFIEALSRTEAKRWHGPHASLRQSPFVCRLPEPAPIMVIVVDDLLTTGATMSRALDAIRSAGVAAFGFGFSGV
jgi:adenine/guanine phosphoribosyltransferase-like PRPP-binding protein